MIDYGPECVYRSNEGACGSRSLLRTPFPREKKQDFSLEDFIHTGQEGFTLVEMIVTIALMTILLSMATGALSYYFAGRSLDVATRELTSDIREAQALAVSSGSTYRILFYTDDSYQLQRRQSGDWVDVEDPRQLPSSVHYDQTSSPSFGGDRVLDFYARGEAEDGQLGLTGRFGMTRTIRVEAETVNIAVSR